LGKSIAEGKVIKSEVKGSEKVGPRLLEQSPVLKERWVFKMVLMREREEGEEF